MFCFARKTAPAHCSLPIEGLQRLSAAVGGAVRQGHPVNEQVEAEPGQGGGYRGVTRCRGDGLQAVPEGARRVQHPQRQELPFRELQVRVKPAWRRNESFLFIYLFLSLQQTDTCVKKRYVNQDE